MTVDEFVDSVCISLNSFLRETQERVKTLLPSSVTHIMSKFQWEETIQSTTLTTSASVDWVNLPSNFSKEYALRRANLKKPLDYITPDKYNEMKAASTTPYGTEAVKYTIMGGSSLKQRRIHFLDPPSSALTIQMLFNIKVDPNALQSVPDEFLPVIKARVIYEMTPPMIKVGAVEQYNPAHRTTRYDYREILAELKSYKGGQRGRDIEMELDDIGKGACQYYHP